MRFAHFAGNPKSRLIFLWPHRKLKFAMSVLICVFRLFWIKSLSHLKKCYKKYLKNRIFKRTFPQRWKIDGISEPTDKCKKLVLSIGCALHSSHKITPNAIAPSIEGGMALFYYHNRLSMGIEVDNDLDVVVLVNNDDKKEILLSQDICISMGNIRFCADGFRQAVEVFLG